MEKGHNFDFYLEKLDFWEIWIFEKFLEGKKFFFKTFTKTENRKKAIFEAKNFWGSRGRRKILKRVLKRTF